MKLRSIIVKPRSTDPDNEYDWRRYTVTVEAVHMDGPVIDEPFEKVRIDGMPVTVDGRFKLNSASKRFDVEVTKNTAWPEKGEIIEPLEINIITYGDSDEDD